MRKTSDFLMRTLALTMVCAMSIGGCPVQAASVEETMQTYNDPAAEGSYVYGTVNLPYADYYYGELNDVEESVELSLDTEDKAAALRADGYLDAVSSATTSKWKSYGPTYFAEHENGDGGGYIYGIGDCPIAVPASLYEEAKALVEDAADDGEQCRNPLLSIVAAMQINEDQTIVPAEYKILNGDGTLTKMRDSAGLIKVNTVSEDSAAKAILLNRTQYGDYQIEITDDNLPDKTDMEGAILEAADSEGNVTKYALLHSDNLWFQTGHIAFPVNAGFVVHNANTLKYKQFTDIQGKTITKVTYIIRGGADVEYTTDLYCKYLLDAEYGYSAENTIYGDGAQIRFTENTPEDSSYTLASVAFGTTVLTEDTDYVYDEDTETLTVKETDSTGIGTYTLTYSDEKYENIVVSVQFTSDMIEDNIKIEDNKLVISDSDVEIAAYVAAIDSITVNGSQLRSTTGVINSDGSVNFAAEINFHGNKTVVFPDENTDYTIAITASGYPAVRGTVTSPDTTALKTVINQSKTLKEADYTAVTWAVLKEALEKAENEAARPQSQKTVNEAASKLADAIAGLVKNVSDNTAENTPANTIPNVPANTPATANPAGDTTVPEAAAKAAVVKKGDAYTVKALKYKVTNASTDGNGTVEVAGSEKKNVTSVTIPATVKIEGAVFKVTSIGKNAFKNCSKLKKITIKTKNLKKVGSGAFKGIYKTAKIKVPASKLKAYKKLLKGKGQGNKVKITK